MLLHYHYLSLVFFPLSSLIIPPPPILVISVCPPDLLWTQDHLKQARSLENENCLPPQTTTLDGRTFILRKMVLLLLFLLL